MTRDLGFPTVPAEAVPWLTVEEMREVDRIMIEELGITLVRMMENAGRGLAVLARRLLGGDASGRRVGVLAGRGGNGGGGLVAARHLAVAGARVSVVLSAEPGRLAPVPGEQLAILERMGVPVAVEPSGLGEPELVLDALLGYRAKGPPRGETAALIRYVLGKRLLALDVPTGLELTTGVLHEPYAAAEATLTLAAPKHALGDRAAKTAVGDLYLADISVPAVVYDRLGRSHASPFATGPIVRVSD